MSEQISGAEAQSTSSKPAMEIRSISSLIKSVEDGQKKAAIPSFRVGDTVKVHVKIREGAKERVQAFEGVVIRRHAGGQSTGTFTVRKISYNIGVERIFFVHSPRIEKIEVLSVGSVRRARLYYLRDLRGKSARIKSQQLSAGEIEAQNPVAAEAVAVEAKSE